MHPGKWVVDLLALIDSLEVLLDCIGDDLVGDVGCSGRRDLLGDRRARNPEEASVFVPGQFMGCHAAIVAGSDNRRGKRAAGDVPCVETARRKNSGVITRRKT